MYRDGNYYLVGSSKGRVNVTNRKGEFLREYDLLSIIDIPANERGDKEVSGFSVDGAGNMLFTVPVLFRAYVVSPDGKLAASFGRAGSAPGMFGIVGGITADEFGNYLVVERLRSVVMVFDKKFRFQHEFGYRGAGKPWNLVRPSELAVGKAGRVYVNQLRGRGVSVFSLIYD
jgi:hypothetical protein